MKHCTYIYSDPKTGAIRYIGEGLIHRARQHLRKGKKSSNAQLSAMIQKRLSEGFKIEPRIILAKNKDDCVEMEILLIALIGRQDLGLGTLFNYTNGGDGITGYKHTDEALEKISVSSRERRYSRSIEYGTKMSMAKAGKRFPHQLKLRVRTVKKSVGLISCIDGTFKIARCF